MLSKVLIKKQHITVLSTWNLVLLFLEFLTLLSPFYSSDLLYISEKVCAETTLTGLITMAADKWANFLHAP